MSNVTVGKIIMDAQRMASRVKDLDALGSALLVEAEGNNRLVESLRQFQDDMDSLNRISNNKTNAEMVNRIQQHNANSSEILKENRELKACVEDYERALELVMQKYREHTGGKILESKLNFKEAYNEKLWKIIRDQREKINEMAAVMQRAIRADDEVLHTELEIMARLRLENKTLRELLQISKQFGTDGRPIRFNDHLLEEKGVQTEIEEYVDDMSLSNTSVEYQYSTVISNSLVPHNSSSNAAISVEVRSNDSEASNSAFTAANTDNAVKSCSSGDNNNGVGVINAGAAVANDINAAVSVSAAGASTAIVKPAKNDNIESNGLDSVTPSTVVLSASGSNVDVNVNVNSTTTTPACAENAKPTTTASAT